MIEKNVSEGSHTGQKENKLAPFVLLVGLGTHAIFEGLALGLTQRYNALVQFSIAIIVHKGAEALAIGISLVKVFPNRIYFNIGLIVFFSMFTPIGVCLGIILTQGKNELYEIIFASIAAGSFIYIACSEVIVQQFN